MSPSTALQKRKRLDAHGGDEGSARNLGPRLDGGESVSASAGAATSLDNLDVSADASPAYIEFATESWTGRKPTNEDRSAQNMSGMAPLGPALAIYDGHGGTFTADFLVRNLFKAVAASVRHQIGDRKLQQLDASVTLSRSECVRWDGIEEQIDFVTTQLNQVAQLTAAAEGDAKDKEEDEMRALERQLKDMLGDLKSEAQRVGDEESDRAAYRRQWFKEQDAVLQSAIVEAFKRADEQILRKNTSRDGSTALMLCFYGGVGDDNASSEETSQQDGRVGEKPMGFYMMNLGDCRAVLCRRGGAVIRLTSDHKPDRPDEKARIERAGGFVGVFSGIARVFSAAGAGLAVESEISTFLAVSRAFGDRSLKTPGALVSCEPEIRRYGLDADDLFIIMACDGIWDVLSDEEAVSIAQRHLQDTKAAAAAVVKAAFMKGSADNLTATVIKFCGHDESATSHNLDTSSDRQGLANVDGRSIPGKPKVTDQAGATLSGRALADTSGDDEVQPGSSDADDEIDMFSLE
jgi:serine/threonine protein phosphatase PrpC